MGVYIIPMRHLPLCEEECDVLYFELAQGENEFTIGHSRHLLGCWVYLKNFFVKGAPVVGGIPTDPAVYLQWTDEKIAGSSFSAGSSVTQGYPLLLKQSHTVTEFETPRLLCSHLNYGDKFTFCLKMGNNADYTFERAGMTLLFTKKSVLC